MKPVNGGHDENVGAEIGSEQLDELDAFADDVAAVEVGIRRRPDQLREEGEESRQEIRQGQVEDEVVHTGHFKPSGKK